MFFMKGIKGSLLMFWKEGEGFPERGGKEGFHVLDGRGGFYCCGR